MRRAHGRIALPRVPGTAIPPYCGLCSNAWRTFMFIRIAWDHSRAPHPTAPAGHCRIALGGRRGYDDLGIPPRDFDKMTRSLFARQD